MDTTLLEDLWLFESWMQGINQAARANNNLANSPAVAMDARLGAQLSDRMGDNVIQLTGWGDDSGQDDELQVEATAPSSQKLTKVSQTGVASNRVHRLDLTSFAQELSNMTPDPLRRIFEVAGQVQNRTYNQVCYSTLRAAIGSTADQGPLYATNLLNIAVEVSGDVTEDTKINPGAVEDTFQLLGENKANLTGGVVYCHSAAQTQLRKLDNIDFVMGSSGEVVSRFWRGMPLILDDRLVRDGTTSGKVYQTFFLAPGAIRLAIRPKVSGPNVISLSSLDLVIDKLTNVAALVNRHRLLAHIYGMKWNPATGVTITNAGPTLAQIADPGNWAWGFPTSEKVLCGVTCLQHNA